MATKTSFTDKEKLFKTPLPNHAATYTVIAHQDIAEHAIRELNNANFQITQEIYKSNLNGQVAYGIYNLDHAKDKDLQMMFAWSNTYDKSRRFRCAIGANVKVSNNTILSGELAAYARKHTGTADHEAREQIIQQIAGAVTHYEQLILDKNALLNQTLSTRQQAEILGVIVHEKEIINLTQLALIQKELKKPSFNYGYDQDSAFLLYNHINHSLKDSHPSVWMDNHQDLHRFFINEFGNIEDRLEESQKAIEQSIIEIMMQEPKETTAPGLIAQVEPKVLQNTRKRVVFV